MERNKVSRSTYWYVWMYLLIQTQHPMLSLCRINIHIFFAVYSISHFQYSLTLFLQSSPILRTFHLWALSHLQGMHWMYSPAIGLAALCPLVMYNQNQHCDVRHRRDTEIKNMHDLECFDESTFFSASYFEYSLTETCELSRQQQCEICERHYIYLTYTYAWNSSL
jgi:hypothetical protein